jgi:probable F420-dependent oxidoreductase
VEHTATARSTLGPGPLLAPEHGVLLERDPVVARGRARQYLARYLDTLPNYRASLLRSGFTEADLEHGGSDRLVDAVVAWGDDDAVADQVCRHLEAGADHVAVQVLGHAADDLPLDAWRRLAAVLVGR